MDEAADHVGERGERVALDVEGPERPWVRERAVQRAAVLDRIALEARLRRRHGADELEPEQRHAAQGLGEGRDGDVRGGEGPETQLVEPHGAGPPAVVPYVELRQVREAADVVEIGRPVAVANDAQRRRERRHLSDGSRELELDEAREPREPGRRPHRRPERERPQVRQRADRVGHGVGAVARRVDREGLAGPEPVGGVRRRRPVWRATTPSSR